jgi:hypothetical protein
MSKLAFNRGGPRAYYASGRQHRYTDGLQLQQRGLVW